MLQSIVGPPMVGATDLKSLPEKKVDADFKGTSSGSSFGKALDDKMSKANPKDTKEPGMKEQRAKDESPKKPSEERASSEVAKPEGRNAKKAVARQQAIQEFMDSFESEFEIPPTRLVEAMAQLSDTQLVQTPEETADAVIAQLPIEDSQVEKAREMYAALLIQLQQMPQQQQAPKVNSEFIGGASISKQQIQLRSADAQGKQTLMNAKVDSLNEKFFPKPDAKLDAAGLKQPVLQNMQIDESSFADLAEETPMDIPAEAMAEMPVAQGPKLPELPPHLKGQMSEAISPALLAALAAKKAAAAQEAQGAVVEEEAPELMDEFSQALQSNKESSASSLQGDSMKSVQGKYSEQMMQNDSQDQSFMQQNSQQGQEMAPVEKEVVGKHAQVKTQSFKHSLEGLEGIHGQPIKGETLKMDPAAVAAAPMTPAAPANPADNEAAVKQLMNQAQYLIKKGGGEMKVQMTPEGMGTIHLKVMLQDGKVNLQMSADTHEAKNAIESSLAELKTSLAAQKLSMENVKVDVVNSTSTDTATQNQTNMNGQGRDQTRQFWNQFNENFGSQGRRESFTEVPGLKGYGSRQRDPLQPIENGSKAQTRSVEGKGRGLNLVA